MTAKKKNDAPSFEEELNRLEALADEMEQGELPLDALMDAYEEGAKLAKALEARLGAAKARLTEVKANRDGNLVTTPSAITAQDAPEDGAE
jgi:exodeoxyribonuclease VII small subunit